VDGSWANRATKDLGSGDQDAWHPAHHGAWVAVSHRRPGWWLLPGVPPRPCAAPWRTVGQECAPGVSEVSHHAQSRSHPSTSRMRCIERLGFPRGRLGESCVLMWLLFLRLLRSTIVLAILRRVWRNRRRIVAAVRRW